MASRKSKSDRREIFHDLKTGELAPIYYLHGEDGFMLDSAVDAIVETALPEGRNEFNFQKFRGSDATADAIRSTADTLPFMTRRRVVIVRDAQKLPAAELDGLAPYFDNPNPTTVLVVVALTVTDKLDGRNKAVAALRKTAAEYEFKELRDYEIAPVLERQAKQFGLRLDRDAAAYLVDAIGTDLATLHGALQKVDIYLGPQNRTATLEAVRSVVSDTRVRSVFDLTNALGSRDVGAALKTLDRMLLAGEEPIGITAMIARHFRIVAKLHDREIHQLDRDKKARALSVHPFFLKDYEADARRFARSDVEEIRKRLVETDLALKSSRLGSRVIMEALLLSVCARAERRG